MEEQEQSAIPVMTNPSPKQPSLCEECKINPSKYKCPGCSIRSCSLPCVKAHKERTSCTGKKQYNDVVPLSRFDDNLLLSDYIMLEDVKRVAESARRMRMKMCGYSHFRLPFPLKSLRSAAASRRTKLLFFSTGMSKREKNRSYYNYRKKYISWTIEWRFHSTNVVLLDHGVHENRSLGSVVENHLKFGPWNHQLRQFCEESLDSLKFFIRKYPKGCKSSYRELNIKEPLRTQLANLVILEYPVIHVYLPSHSYDFEVIKDAVPQRAEVKESARTDDFNQTGVTFREEEIEEDSTFNTQVSDLMSNTNLHAKLKTCSPKMGRDDKLGESFDSRTLAILVEGSISDFRVDTCNSVTEDDIKNTEKSTFSGNDVLDLGQGFVDTHQDVTAQTNPSDFMDFDGVLTEDLDVEGRRDYTCYTHMEEQLEEGELVESPHSLHH